MLNAADEKNREGNSIPLRADLATNLREWIADKAAATVGNGSIIRFVQEQTGVPPNTPLFIVPDGLVKILDRDLKAAGIPKRDERGRTVDVHAMRTTFGTLLSKGGVKPRTAQAAMRHSDINLTMNTYTDPKLLDVAGAMEALPSLPLTTGKQRDRIAVKATGTDDLRPSQFTPKFTPTAGKQGLLRSTVDKNPTNSEIKKEHKPNAVSGYAVNVKGPLTTPVNRPDLVRLLGFEPRTCGLKVGLNLSHTRL